MFKIGINFNNKKSNVKIRKIILSYNFFWAFEVSDFIRVIYIIKTVDSKYIFFVMSLFDYHIGLAEDPQDYVS